MKLTQTEKDLIQDMYSYNPKSVIYYEDYNNNNNNKPEIVDNLSSPRLHLYYKDFLHCNNSYFADVTFFPVYIPNIKLEIYDSYFLRSTFNKVSNRDLKDSIKGNLFSQTDFINSTFHDLHFISNITRYVCFKKCIFRNCHFYYNLFESVSFVGCVFENCNFYENSFCITISFDQCDFNTVVFQNNSTRLSTISTVTGKGLSTITTDEFYGTTIGYKKCWVKDLGERQPCIVTLLIPNDAKINKTISRKHRCSKAKVLRIESVDGNVQYTEARSLYVTDFIYKVGETVDVSDFDETPFKTCSTGIHFFLNRKDAENYII